MFIISTIIIFIQEQECIKMTDQTWYILIKDSLIVIAALIGSISAFWGLKTWRRQIKYKAEYDIAKRFMKCIYQLREAIKNVREPFQTSEEISESLKAEGLNASFGEKEWSIKSSRAVYNQRWKKLVEVLTQLDVEKLEAEVHWEEKTDELYKPIYQKVEDLHYAIKAHLEILKDGFVKINKEEYAKIIKIKNDESNQSGDDDFMKDLKTKIRNLEEFIKTKLKYRQANPRLSPTASPNRS